MTPMKRFLDVLAVLVLAMPLLPLGLLTALAILIMDGRPVIYWAERMKTPTQSFKLAKFRSMTVAPAEAGVSGGDKASRITRTGRFIRRTRLDELPQLVERAEGRHQLCRPAPTAARICRALPRDLRRSAEIAPRHHRACDDRLSSPRGIAAGALQDGRRDRCVYARACVPRKAKLDLLYQKRRNLRFDFYLMLKTVFKRLPL